MMTSLISRSRGRTLASTLLLSLSLLGSAKATTDDWIYNNLPEVLPGFYSYGSNAGPPWYVEHQPYRSQPFVTGDFGRVSSIDVYIINGGSARGSLKLWLMEDEGGIPGATIAELGEIDLAPLPVLSNSNEIGAVVTLDTNVRGLTPNTPYHIGFDMHTMPDPDGNFPSATYFNLYDNLDTGTRGAGPSIVRPDGEWELLRDWVEGANYMLMRISQKVPDVPTRVLYHNGSDPFGEDFDTWIYPIQSKNRFGAQQFLTDDLGYVSTFTFGMGQVGDGTTGDLVFELWDSQGGEPGQPLATLGTVDVATLPSTTAGGQVVTLSVPPIPLEPNTPYFLVIDGVHVPTPNANQTVAFAVHHNDANGTRGALDFVVADAVMPGEPLDWNRVATGLGKQFTHMVMSVTVSHLTVTNTEDDGPGSLRQAAADCPEGGIITFAPELNGQTITFLEEPFEITGSMTIDASALPGGLTLSAVRSCEDAPCPGTRVLYIPEDANVLIDSLTFANTRGGGIENRGSLTLQRCTVIGNQAVRGHPFSPSVAGGISNTGILKIENSTIAANSASVGAAITNSNSLTIINSTISGNIGRQAISSGSDSASVTILDSTICNNTDGLREGGGISIRGGSLSISGSVIAGNAPPHMTPDVSSHPLFGANGYEIFSDSGASVSLGGSNLISDLAGSGLTEGASLLVADPRLAPLGFYGGPTMTMPPLPGSPAIDAAVGNDAATDQRGFPRVGAPDLGAAEYQGDADFARLFPVDNDGDGIAFGLEQALGTDPFTADPHHPRNLTAPTFNAEGHAVVSFGINPGAHADTVWILERSTDLQTFTEIYRHDGVDAVHAENMSAVLDGDLLTVTDENPPAESAFYRFRASLDGGGE